MARSMSSCNIRTRPFLLCSGGLLRPSLLCQGFVYEMTQRCKVTGFVTGNINERYIKGLAGDVEALLTVCSRVPYSCLGQYAQVSGRFICRLTCQNPLHPIWRMGFLACRTP